MLRYVLLTLNQNVTGIMPKLIPYGKTFENLVNYMFYEKI